MQDSRLYSLDFLKFVAALMITNSHFQPLYEDVSPSLATYGVHGNALFFFVSGFLLMMGFERKKVHGFLNWYKGAYDKTLACRVHLGGCQCCSLETDSHDW